MAEKIEDGMIRAVYIGVDGSYGMAFIAKGADAIINLVCVPRGCEDEFEYVELFAPDDGYCGYCDGFGKIKGLPVNPLATVLYRSRCGTGDTINGPLLIVGNDEGEETGLDEETAVQLICELNGMAERMSESGE